MITRVENVVTRVRQRRNSILGNKAGVTRVDYKVTRVSTEKERKSRLISHSNGYKSTHND